ncbi:MAG: hypothetical protein IBX47_01630 [Desulfuromonadales bacterium]|nr:hypothetical protein [Desulfuromonadales bacterium]
MIENRPVTPLRTVKISRHELRAMARLVYTVERLSALSAYRAALLHELPEVARFNPGHASVMMGYDFHLGADGPSLIEVNTNAGGGLLALQAASPLSETAFVTLDRRLKARLRRMFANEIRNFSAGRSAQPTNVVILDEEPDSQFLYPEMQAFYNFFVEWGCSAAIADPKELLAGTEGVWHQGKRVDLIYNRHCDFYLETAVLSGLRQAYLQKTVCLTPNPFYYGLQADKRRLCFWSDPEALAKVGLDQTGIDLLQSLVPKSRMFGSFDPALLWAERKQWVFKPATQHASRGVLVGAKMTRNRYQELTADTIVQRYVPPSINTLGENQFKTDFRLFTYRNGLLGIAARLYRGQVTNLRTEGGGFAAVSLSD